MHGAPDDIVSEVTQHRKPGGSRRHIQGLDASNRREPEVATDVLQRFFGILLEAKKRLPVQKLALHCGGMVRTDPGLEKILDLFVIPLLFVMQAVEVIVVVRAWDELCV